MFISNNCPFCGISVRYWSNCSASTNPDYGNIGRVTTKRKTKIIFHKSCFYNSAKKKEARNA